MRAQEFLTEAEKRCPPATQSIDLNLKNRQKAITEYGYGPLDPNEPNNKFWSRKAQMWQLDSVDDAKSSRCGNCAAFDKSEEMLACIAQGIGSEPGSDPYDTIDAGDLGYCKFLKFKCAASRTCDAWVEGGPITEDADNDSDRFMALAREFIPFVKERLGLEQLPKIEFLDQPLNGTFGRYGDDGVIRVVVAGRHPVDVLRTLAHELIHFHQDQAGELHDESGATGSPEENEANAAAGIVMRDFSQQFPDAITDLSENFKDGKNPGRKGLAKRSGVNCKASVSSLRRTAKNSSGEKQRMAHWCANMKSGRQKK